MFGVRLSKMGSASKLGLIAKAIGILRKYGTDAHVYLPGIGTVNGITAGNYLDSAGTTSASVDNPVGLVLDAAGVTGPELFSYVSGDTGVTNNAGVISFSSVAVSSGATGAVTLATGKSYQVTFTVTGFTAGGVSVKAGSTGTAGVGAQANGTFTEIFSPTGSSGPLQFVARYTTTTLTVSGISVREVTGIHATQATTANKPILRRGLLNLLTQAQTYSHADWVENTTGTASAPTLGALQLAPDGTTTAQRVTFSCPGALISDQSMLDHASMTVVSGQPHTQIAYIKGTPGQTISFRNVAGVNYGNLTFDGTWQLLTRAETSISTTGSWSIGLRGTTGSTTGTVVADLWTAGLFQGTLTAQQILDAGGIPLTTTAAASNTSAGKYSWQFDGISNDSLSLSAPLFQMSDDHCVIAGFKADAANKYIFSHSNSGTPTQCCSLRVDASGYPGAVWFDDASANALPTATTSCIGLSTVATAIKIGNAKRLRVNGVQAGATNNTALGVGTTNSYAIGCLNVSSGNFQGSIYPLIGIKGTVSDADLLTLERFVGQLSGVSI